jgi:hypothetical protein
LHVILRTHECPFKKYFEKKKKVVQSSAGRRLITKLSISIFFSYGRRNTVF